MLNKKENKVLLFEPNYTRYAPHIRRGSNYHTSMIIQACPQCRKNTGQRLFVWGGTDEDQFTIPFVFLFRRQVTP